jgi:hypothetical protein
MKREIRRVECHKILTFNLIGPQFLYEVSLLPLVHMFGLVHFSTFVYVAYLILTLTDLVDRHPIGEKRKRKEEINN